MTDGNEMIDITVKQTAIIRYITSKYSVLIFMIFKCLNHKDSCSFVNMILLMKLFIILFLRFFVSLFIYFLTHFLTLSFFLLLLYFLPIPIYHLSAYLLTCSLIHSPICFLSISFSSFTNLFSYSLNHRPVYHIIIIPRDY